MQLIILQVKNLKTKEKKIQNFIYLFGTLIAMVQLGSLLGPVAKIWETFWVPWTKCGTFWDAWSKWGAF